MPIERFYATGKRKNAIARVWLAPGSGTVTVNKRRNLQEYFPRETLRIIAEQPLALTNNHGNFDIYVLASGGGISGQAGAVRHGIAKALESFDSTLRPVLKKAGLLTRDSREKERKK
ncbi:MAG: 30S ribosomal protein S9, partial [Deltaproteobacteria bacterium]|nr:30S ribosomal protein S9 [Deltaproteobacteria bacterium]